MNKFILSLLILVFSFGLSPAKALPLQDSGGIPIRSHEEVLAHEEAEVIGVKKMDLVFYYTEELLRRTSMRKFLREELREYLTVSKEAQERYGFKERLTDISEGQLYLLLYKNPKIYDAIEEYIHNVPVRVADHDVEDKEIAKRFRGAFKEMMQNTRVRNLFTRLNRPTKPVPLFYKDGRPGFTSVDIFSSIPYNEVDFQNGKVVVSDAVHEKENLLDELIKFIDGAKEVLMINVFEFDIPRIAEHIIAARRRGVDVYIGIDKEHIHNDERELIRDMFRAEEALSIAELTKAGVEVKTEPRPTIDKPMGGYLHFTEVDTHNLNHQKIAVRYPHLNGLGGVMALSSNWTFGGIHPGGDLKKDGIGVEKVMPNSNQATLYQSDILAKVVAHELRKTVILDFKGTSQDNSYPLSNSYRIMGPMAESPSGPYQTHLIAAFTPNGGLDKANGFLLDNLLYYTEGPMGVMQFSASSNEVSEAIIDRLIREYSKNGDFEFYGISDYKGGIAEWSIFLDIIGMKLVKLSDGTKLYVDDPENKLFSAFSKAEIDKLRSRVVLAPKSMFEHQKITLPDGTKKTISILQHSKIILSGYTSTAGSSLNPSVNSESNQEQLFILSHPKVAQKVAGMVSYLFQQTNEKDILYNKILSRNVKHLKNKSEAIRAEAQKLIEESTRLAYSQVKFPAAAVCSNFFRK